MKMIGTEERERKESKCMAEANLLYINTGEGTRYVYAAEGNMA